ncbi:MAG: cytochrome c [Planctomycetota bacterium]|nr:MAG: cytochrome c [Planctomycetota bacterium]
MLAVATLALPAGLTAGCRGERTAKRPRQFFPGMDDQPKYQPQEASTFFADGRAMREPVAGAVPFGARPDEHDEWLPVGRQRRDFLKADDRVYLGVNADGSYVETIPVRAVLGLAEGEPVPPGAVRALIERGQDRYTIFCIVCHGGTGDGKGMVGLQWSYNLPNFHDPQYQPGGEKGQDGYLFHVIRNGVANAPGAQPPLRMPSYAERVSERDAWAIVAYLRALQETDKGEIADVPAAQRRDLLNSRGATAPAGGTN